jgi:hypothetical protein
MKKMSTLFEIVYTETGKKGEVLNKIRTENKWVYDKGVVATRKYDGSACAIINGKLYKRLDCKIEIESGEYKKPIPFGAIPCQEPDIITGHHPHWILCSNDNPADKYFIEAFNLLHEKNNGTYELCGKKVNGNKEQLENHILIPHGKDIIILEDFEFETIKEFLAKKENDIEGIVFWHPDGMKCKIRKSDFGFSR